MPDILIRGLSDEVIAKLKKRAADKGHSLQAEVREILDAAAEEFRRQLAYEARLAEMNARARAGRGPISPAPRVNEDSDE